MIEQSTESKPSRGERKRARKTVEARARIPMRNARILELRGRGMKIGEIAHTLQEENYVPLSQTQIRDILAEALDEASQAYIDQRHRHWALALERLEQAIRLHQSIMLDANLKPDVRGRAAERMVNVIARQAKMMGFDQAATLQLSDGQSSISLDVAQMDDDTLAKELQGFIGGVEATMRFHAESKQREIEVSVGRPDVDLPPEAITEEDPPQQEESSWPTPDESSGSTPTPES